MAWLSVFKIFFGLTRGKGIVNLLIRLCLSYWNLRRHVHLAAKLEYGPITWASGKVGLLFASTIYDSAVNHRACRKYEWKRMFFTAASWGISSLHGRNSYTNARLSWLRKTLSSSILHFQESHNALSCIKTNTVDRWRYLITEVMLPIHGSSMT